MRIPKLDATILGTAENPVAMRCKSNTEYEVLVRSLVSSKYAVWRICCYLVPFEGSNTFAARSAARNHTRWSSQLPHLDRLVQATTNKPVACRSESDRVNAILVTQFTLKANDQLASVCVPDTDALIERSGCNEAVVWRNGHRGDSIFDREMENLVIRLKIP